MAKPLVSVYYDLPELQAMKETLALEAKIMKVAEVPHYHVILELERLYRQDNAFGRDLRNRVRIGLLASKLKAATIKARKK